MFFREQNKIVTAIDIGTASIKSVSIKREGDTLMLNNYNELYTSNYVGKEVGEYVKMGRDQLAEAMMDSYGELNVKSDKVVIGIPASECIFKNIKLPANVSVLLKDKTVIESVLKLEFKKALPSLEVLNYTFTFSEISRNEEFAEYLVLAIDSRYLSDINDVASKMGVQYLIEPNIFGGVAMLPQNINQNTVLINIGANNVNIVFINNAKMVGVENMTVGINKVIFNVKNSMLMSYKEARDLVLAFDYLDEEDLILKDIIKLSTINIINDIIDILNRYELRYNIRYSKVYIGGSSAKILNTKTFYQNNLSRDVEVVKPFDRVELPQILKDTLYNDSSVFMNAVGLAIKHIA